MGQARTDETVGTTGGGSTAVADRSTVPRTVPVAPSAPGLTAPPAPLPDGPGGTDALTVLDDPRLVLAETYIGVDRRRPGRPARFGRATHGPRRRMLQLDLLIVLSVVTGVVVAGLLVMGGAGPTRTGVLPATPTAARPAAVLPDPSSSRRAPTPTPTPTPAPAAAAASSTPTTPPVAVATPTPAAPTTPDAMGAAALALVRYPWQQIPGYSIVFKSIDDAPSPGYYGNTAFAWGSTGGTSTLYVYPGETVDQLAGITAFEIGHEVDAAYVEPLGGHAQIAALLGIHPASWAPECDCGEQGYLSGWYAAAFSDYWSPGVGQWSTLAPEPSGALQTAMVPWLDPRTT